MSINDFIAAGKIVIDPGFSPEDRKTIIDAMEYAYKLSPTARRMFDNMAENIDLPLRINFVPGEFKMVTYLNPDGSWTKDRWLEIDLAELNSATYIDNYGTAVKDTPVTAIVHELVHALTGRSDNDDLLDREDTIDYRQPTVTFSNIIYRELGLPEQNAYRAYDSTGNILSLGYHYTQGAVIDRSRVVDDGNWNSAAAGNSDDLLIGGAGGNTLIAGEGNDFLYGGGGEDTLYGDGYNEESGKNEAMQSDGGDDYLYGGDGNDEIWGGKGNDVIYGDDKDHSLFSGDDTIYGGSGRDTIYGGRGNDTIYGETQNNVGLYEGWLTFYGDEIYGGAGTDHIYGGWGDDVIYGDGNDAQSGKDENQQGGGARDYLYGGDGSDKIYGGRGDDFIYGDGDDDESGKDESKQAGGGRDFLYGGGGGDTMYGGKGDDYLYGDGYDDASSTNENLQGLGGEDHLYGGSGNDHIWGGKGNDHLYGDAGNDYLYGGTGDDHLHGGSGNNHLNGGDGKDKYYIGQSGNGQLSYDIIIDDSMMAGEVFYRNENNKLSGGSCEDNATNSGPIVTYHAESGPYAYVHHSSDPGSKGTLYITVAGVAIARIDNFKSGDLDIFLTKEPKKVDFNPAQKMRSPLVLDLDGDGIETIGVDSA